MVAITTNQTAREKPSTYSWRRYKAGITQLRSNPGLIINHVVRVGNQ